MIIKSFQHTENYKRVVQVLHQHLHPQFRIMSLSKEAPRPPLPPFTKETAIQNIRLAENSWNSQDPNKVKMAYSQDTVWRNRSTFLKGRDEVRDFLADKWQREQDYRLIKELWAYTDNKIAVRYCYEYHDADGKWFRAHGNENWQFDEEGLMTQLINQ